MRGLEVPTLATVDGVMEDRAGFGEIEDGGWNVSYLDGQYKRSAKGEAVSESTNTAARERLQALVGTWTMEAKPPGGPPWPGGGRVTFEWLEKGVPLLIERSHVDLPEAPDGVTVIGCDGMSGTYYQLYTDERDVQRVYEMSLDDRVWKLWRDGKPFSQRFAGRFSEDGKTIAGRWEAAEDGRSWKTDFDLTYTKVE